MARIDDYNQAFDLAKNELADKNPDLIATYSGAEILRGQGDEVTISLTFLNKVLICGWPDLRFSIKASGEELPIQQQVLLLHYLQGAWSAGGAKVRGEWISYLEVPDGKFYMDAFLKRAKVPLVQAFGESTEQLVEVAGRAYGANPFDHGDISVLIQALPLVPVALILWKEDDEFPPEGNILFDKSISKFLSAEDIAWLSGMIVYPMMGMLKGKG